ncbi:MAG: NAD(P)H-hydrate dehydratase [Candidatus Marinimicrobia bacterium]|nr:NAD(P)H-hydrate dehydratase [Candidatus Neomarinimicrobiota bacterium]
MMHVLKTEASRGLDSYTVVAGSKTELELMRNAGRAVAVEAAKAVDGDTSRALLVIAGKGHNGGDGIAAAGFLNRWDYSCRVELLGTLAEQDPVVGATYLEADLEVSESAEPHAITWTDYALVIDALLGVGVTQPLREPVLPWVQALHPFDGPVLAVDVPTGLGSDTGQVWNESVNARLTVTMGYPKLGLLLNAGPAVSGRVVVADIGFDAGYFAGGGSALFQFQREDFAALNRVPARQTFKHRQGKVLVVAGSRGMTGAAVLAAEATLLAGAGLALAACPLSLQPLYVTSLMPAVMTAGLADNQEGRFLPAHVAALKKALGWSTALVVGPGLSREPDTLTFVTALVEQAGVPILIDADGLAPYADSLELLSATKAPLVLTPHAQEFAQLFGVELREVQDDPVGVLEQVHARIACTVVLKGAPTLTLLSTGSVVVNSTGNPGLATAGSGDVLSGVIGTFLSQGYSADDAALMGVWLHGRAGDLARASLGAQGLTSPNLLEQLPLALAEFDPWS